MDLEEEHLSEDPEYREYAAKTPYRLVPGIY
jgi:protein-S-isoprenylcysteine O-methyltransferase Ste14